MPRWFVPFTCTLALLLSASTAEGRRSRRPSGPAAEAFERGAKHFKQLNYKGAIEAFEESYRLAPHWLTLCNIARCHVRRSDMIKAAEYYQRCLKDGGERSRMKKRFKRALESAQALIATVRVTSPGAGGIVYIDGRSRGAAPVEVRVNSGSHVVEVRRTGARPAQETLETRGGSHELELVPVAEAKPAPPPPPKKEPVKVPLKEPPPAAARQGLSSTWFWIGAGLTAALAISAGVVGGLTIKANSDFEAQPTWDGYHEVLDLRLVTNILWGVTAAAATTSAVLFFYTDFGGSGAGSKEDPEGDEMALVIGVQGRF